MVLSMTPLELRELYGEEIRVATEGWPLGKMLMAYKYFRAQGCRDEAIERRTDEAIRNEAKERG